MLAKASPLINSHISCKAKPLRNYNLLKSNDLLVNYSDPFPLHCSANIIRQQLDQSKPSALHSTF